MPLSESNTAFIPIRWKCAGQTDVGMVREVNEDALIMRPEIGFWAVADGMGGHEVGDVASKKIVEILASVENAERLCDFVDAIDDALLEVNQELLDYARQHLENASMGSTVVSLIIRGRVGVAIWVGDSRLYRYRNAELSQLTRDHSQVEEMLQMGLIRQEEVEDHPQKNVITRAVGGENELFVDVSVFSVQIGDTFLLCSDGLYNSVSLQELRENLTYREVSVCAEKLMQQSLANQASDNVSLIVLKGEQGK